MTVNKSANAANILFRDVLFNALGMFIVVLLILITMINPPQEETPKAPAAGNMIVSISWPEGDNDVDLWVSDPRSDSLPVGFSRRTNQHWDLLRDDRGNLNDPLATNYENAFTRGFIEGEYTFNVVCFSCHYGMPIKVVVRVETSINNVVTMIQQRMVELTYDDEQITVFNLIMSEEGKLVSVHYAPKVLYESQGASPEHGAIP